jgi:hypothetical protein
MMPAPGCAQGPPVGRGELPKRVITAGRRCARRNPPSKTISWGATALRRNIAESVRDHFDDLMTHMIDAQVEVRRHVGFASSDGCDAAVTAGRRRGNTITIMTLRRPQRLGRSTCTTTSRCGPSGSRPSGSPRRISRCPSALSPVGADPAGGDRPVRARQGGAAGLTASSFGQACRRLACHRDLLSRAGSDRGGVVVGRSGLRTTAPNGSERAPAGSEVWSRR